MPAADPGRTELLKAALEQTQRALTDLGLGAARAHLSGAEFVGEIGGQPLQVSLAGHGAGQGRVLEPVPVLTVRAGPGTADHPVVRIWCAPVRVASGAEPFGQDPALMVDDLDGPPVRGLRSARDLAGDGLIDDHLPDLGAALERAAALLRLLTVSAADDTHTPARPRVIADAAPISLPGLPDDARRAVAAWMDAQDRGTPTHLTLQPDHAPAVLTVLGRREGQRVGVLCSQPLAGTTLGADAVAKAARFRRRCADWGIPVQVIATGPAAAADVVRIERGAPDEAEVAALVAALSCARADQRG
ncbi:carboxyl transferase domain-containing protein [Dermacoccaceae bacterium W4C1]